ncbi:diguanylate cyclase [Dokdonella immobilis]|nr:diguanylate cyclase [Dokdonella immobilis]
MIAMLAATPAMAQQVRLGAGSVVGVEPAQVGSTTTPELSPFADPASPLGRYALLLDEQPGQPLTLEQARAHLAAGDFRRSTVDIPNLGNRSPPRWLHFAIDNTQPAARDYRIYVAEGWTDRVDAWLIRAGEIRLHWQGGDERSPSHYLRPGIGFAFDASLPPGPSELFLRVDSVDSVALAPRIVALADASELEGAAQHWLGLVHGFLLALVVTYGLLWLTLRETSLLRYVAYVASYLYMHLAYSGIAAHALWPDSPAIGRFAILVGMTLFASSGIAFARQFLRMRQWAPRLDRTLAWLVRLALAAMAIFVVANAQGPAVDFAFAYIMAFTLLMVAFGVLGVRHRQDQAKLFLVASLISMIGAMVATLAVMGKLPFNAVTFRAIEIGVMTEASIWALALGLRLRRDREGRVRALQLAQHDPLTGLLNRRGFLDRALPALKTASSAATPLAVIMLDIDHFKSINDQHGHDAGDRTLVAVAECLRDLVSSDGLIARWGGEEFVILLPAMPQTEAVATAERLRARLADLTVILSDGREIRLTVSLGIAISTTATGLEDLLRQADDALYKAKQAGRNRAEIWAPLEMGAAE